MRRVKKPENVEVGSRLHCARGNLGYTQAQFAEVLSITDEQYRKIEAGVSGLSIDKMKILYEKFLIDPTYLVIGQTQQDFDLDAYMANCTKQQRDEFIGRMLAYMGKLMIAPLAPGDRGE